MPMRNHAWYSAFIQRSFDVFHSLHEIPQQIFLTGEKEERTNKRLLTCSLKSVINNVEPSRTPTVASSSNLTPSGLSGNLTLTGKSNAGVTRPSARLSTPAQSFRKNSLADFIAVSHFAYSCRADSSVMGIFEPGMKEAVDLSLVLFFLVA